MNDFFAMLIFGHLIGDYIFQNKWMALRKTENIFICIIHCVIYTISVAITTWPYLHGWRWISLIFLSHFLIDRWSLAEKWLELINGRSLRDFLLCRKDNAPEVTNRVAYYILRGGFTALVYTVVDNALHLIVMWYGAKKLIIL